MRFNLDTYIMKNEKGYLINDKGSLFVELKDDFIKPISGDTCQDGLREITRDEFIAELVKK